MEVLVGPVAPAQSVLYRFLAEGFSPPKPLRLEFLATMLETVQAACAELSDSGLSLESPPDLARVAQCLALARAAQPGELTAEYRRLFVEGTPFAPCRLVESVQREGVVRGRCCEAIIQTYHDFGLEVAGREPDHLTMELEFLAELAATPGHDLAEAERFRRTRIAFLHDHLLRWAVDLADRVRQLAEEPLYPALADLLEWMLAAEARQRA